VETSNLLGNLATKIFHANGEKTTNEWATGTIGQHEVWKETVDRSVNKEAGGGARNTRSFSSGVGYRQEWEDIVPPGDFTTLRTGGPANKNKVDAIVFKAKVPWVSSGTTCIRVYFEQPKR